MTRISNWVLAALIVSLLFVGTALAQSTPSIECSVIAAGDGSGSAGNTSLEGTIGQWMVGSGTDGTTQLNSGFGALLVEDDICGTSAISGIYLPLILKNFP
jgi:hypothetical protein